ncbi:hypothetical protein D3C75_728510 [compost metagenome]
MDDYDIIFFGPVYNGAEKFRRCACAGRVVRIVQIEQLRLAGDVFRNGVQVRQEVVFLLEFHCVDLSA